MSQSPTTLAAPAPALPSGPALSKFPVKPLVVAVLAGSFITAMGIGSIAYYVVNSRRLSNQTLSAIAQPHVQTATHLLVLEPLVVNLADPAGNAYLRVSIALQVENTMDNSSKQNNEPNVPDSGLMATLRDATLTELGKQTSDRLLAADGKERLKSDLKVAFARRAADLKVVNIFFTDFLVQR